MKHPAGVICYWLYEDNGRRLDPLWSLSESFPIDADGHPVGVTPATGDGEWNKWLFRAVTVQGSHDGNDYPDLEPIMGRAVTAWTFSTGPRLLGLHPPAWIGWLAAGFWDNLCQNPDWAFLLERGYDMKAGTIWEAQKWVGRDN